MTVLTKRAVEVFAPTTAGGQLRGADMAESMVWGTEVERSINGAAVGRVDQATWAGLAAIAGTRAGQPAIVYGPDAGTHTDPVTGAVVPNIGEYYWSASPAGWRRVGNLQRTLVHALNTGAGTANAVQATSDVQFSQAAYSALITVNFVASNTGPMTLSINGEAPRPLVTNTGEAITPGYIVNKMSALVQIDSDGNYRLFSYGDATAILAAAEAAATRAEIAAENAEAIAGIEGIATEAEAKVQDETTASNTKIMTVLRTLQAVRASLKEFGMVSIRTLGAKGDYDFNTFSGSNDTLAIQNTFDAIMNEGRFGGEVLVPPGSYQIVDTITIPLPTGVPGGDFGRISMRGYGAAASEFVINDPVGFIQNRTGAGAHSYQKIQGLRFRAVGGVKTRNGLSFNGLAFCEFADLVFENFNIPINASDILSSNLRNVIFRGNNYGIICQRDDASHPNAIAFEQCRFMQCSTAGAYFNNPSAVSFNGGSVEGCGTAANASTAGIFMANPGNEGSTGVALRGMYFEGNMGGGDFYSSSSGLRGDVGYDFTGNSFSRINSDTATNCIRISSEAGFAASFHGNGFKGFDPGGGAYVPSAARKYIALSATDLFTISVDEGANYYHADVERPSFAGMRRKAFDNVPSASGYVSAAGVLAANSRGIFSASKTATGVYLITFLGQDKSQRHCNASIMEAGLINTASQTTDGSGRTTIQVATYTSGGTLADKAFAISSVGGW